MTEPRPTLHARRAATDARTRRAWRSSARRRARARSASACWSTSARYTGRIHLVNADTTISASGPAIPPSPHCPKRRTAPSSRSGREAVEQVVEECIDAGAGGAIVFASGYAETGKPERLAQQERLAALAREVGDADHRPELHRRFGDSPSCARITFMPSREPPPPARGAIGIVSQSGALGYALSQAADRGVSVSHVLTIRQFLRRRHGRLRRLSSPTIPPAPRSRCCSRA